MGRRRPRSSARVSLQNAARQGKALLHLLVACRSCTAVPSLQDKAFKTLPGGTTMSNVWAEEPSGGVHSECLGSCCYSQCCYCCLLLLTLLLFPINEQQLPLLRTQLQTAK